MVSPLSYAVGPCTNPLPWLVGLWGACGVVGGLGQAPQSDGRAQGALFALSSADGHLLGLGLVGLPMPAWAPVNVYAVPSTWHGVSIDALYAHVYGVAPLPYARTPAAGVGGGSFS